MRAFMDDIICFFPSVIDLLKRSWKRVSERGGGEEGGRKRKRDIDSKGERDEILFSGCFCIIGYFL